MRHLKNIDAVFHAFANQTEQNGQASSVFFEGNKLYSFGYHYTLAEFINPETVMINDKGYSVTTSNHINLARMALSHKKQFFITETDPKIVLRTIQINISKLINARKPALYLLPSFRLWKKLNEYITYTKNKTIKKTIEYKEIRTLIRALEKDPRAGVSALNKFAKSKARTAKKLLLANFSREKKEFRSFKRDQINGYSYMHDLLRVSKDGLNIETSQRVDIPIKEAKRLLTLIERKKILGATVDDKYTVTAFNGVLKVGCHNIPIEEINRIKELI